MWRPLNPTNISANMFLTRAKGIILNSLVVLTSIMLVLILAEVTLRTISPYPFFTKKYPLGYNHFKTSVASVFDTYLGYFPHPGHHPNHPNFGNEQKTHFENGIRSNYVYPKNWEFDERNNPAKLYSGGKFVIAVGDSFVEGVEVGNNKTWPAYLERATGHIVLNGGVGGYGLDQSFLRAEVLVKQYNTRQLIISFIPDDLERAELSARSGAWKPYFEYVNGEIKLTTDHILPPKFLNPALVASLRDKYSFLAHSFLVMKIMEVISSTSRSDWLVQFGGAKKVHDDGGLIGCGIMKKLASLSAEYSIDVIILMQYPDYYFDEPSNPLKGFVNEYFAKAMLVKSCALKENLKVVDLFDSLKLARQNNLEDFKRLYVGERRHMSGAGNYFVAKHLTNVINTINN